MAAAVVRSCEIHGIAIVGFDDPALPEPLRQIPAPPALIYARGSLDALRLRGFAVVGTCRASASGTEIARAIASRLTERGFAVVSGLAFGIDAAELSPEVGDRGLKKGGVPSR
jgi:DNA processing protein